MREKDRIEPWMIDEDLEPNETNETSDACPTPDAPLSVARIRCPVCEGPDEEDAGDGWTRCAGCATRYRRVRPSRGQLAADRDARLTRSAAAPGTVQSRTAKEQAGEIMRGYFSITRGTPAARNAFGLHVLDVGCEAGRRMRVFEDYGWSAVGTETAGSACARARQHGLDARQGWLTELDFGNARFDLAVVSGTFGESPDPNAFCERLWRVLKTGGLLCVNGEPLAPDGIGEGRLFSYAPEGLSRLVCRNRFVHVSDAVADGNGTFWFQATARRHA